MFIPMPRFVLFLFALVLLLFACIAAALSPAWSKPRSIVRITEAPPSRTSDREAVFRFKAPGTQTWCRLAGREYRSCRSAIKFTGLRPGRHSFIVRARQQGKTEFVRHRWTITAGDRLRSREASADGSTTTDPATGAVKRGARLIFADEFDGTTLDASSWGLYHSPGHDGNGLRRPSAFSLDGRGNLVVTAKMINGMLVSGGMASLVDFKYGRVEFRVKAEPDPTGTMSAVVLTWPKEESSAEYTENDMYETGPRVNNRRHLESFIHFGPPERNWQAWVRHRIDPSKWHTVAMDWTADHLEIYIDGMLTFSVTDKAVIPDVLHHVCIQLDARAKRKLKRPVRLWVDYVRVYQ